ncbi:ORF6N domain-containing protein [Salmonella enterica subsp. enterica serovar Oranienburg]|nr:ORF6N domain-containing protein [Salmonella enterica]EBG5027583.1 ORF6N domain-containing protein [Salmonella enterica subsp. enterica serovar Oranienburg]EAS1262592.1 ORF6N domain-containing protein [Salmonella enterica]EBB1607965.1 ORF6N domain-containing protein [Salmonella enterica]EBB9531832.1 ORF6N domain-containing protein [Salmonella enterica]
MTSQEIADLVGSRHDSVKRTIERLVNQGVIVQPPLVDERGTDSIGRQRITQAYVFSDERGKRDSIIVVAQLYPELTARLVDRWRELESGARHPAVEFDWRNNPAQLRNILIGFTEQVEQVTAERDEAIRAKSRISRKREASALGKLSAATRRCRDLEEQLGESSKHATIIKVEKATRGKFDYVPLRRWCKDNGVEAKAVPDERYGSVKSWPAGAWLDIYGIDLKSLFGEKK